MSLHTLMSTFNISAFVCLPAWLHSSAPGGPAGTHRHCDTVAEAWSSAQRDNNSEHEHLVILKIIHNLSCRHAVRDLIQCALLCLP